VVARSTAEAEYKQEQILNFGWRGQLSDYNSLSGLNSLTNRVRNKKK
jgi:hypothetical protein